MILLPWEAIEGCRKQDQEMDFPLKMLIKKDDTSGLVHPLGPSQLVHLRATQSGTDGHVLHYRTIQPRLWEGGSLQGRHLCSGLSSKAL